MKTETEIAVEEKPVDDLRQQAEDYKILAQQIQADFENYKKRCKKELSDIEEQSKREFISKLLPVLDSLELAIKSMNRNEKTTQGIMMIYSQLHSTLQDMGLRKIESEGKKFDPYKHDVMLTTESEQDGIVLEEMQRGYMVGDAVIRHSKVRIGKKMNENE